MAVKRRRDSGYCYFGDYSVFDDRFAASVRITKHNPLWVKCVWPCRSAIRHHGFRRDRRSNYLVSVHAGGGVFGLHRSSGCGVVGVAIGPGGKVELRDFNLNRERTDDRREISAGRAVGEGWRRRFSASGGGGSAAAADIQTFTVRAPV